MREGEVRDIGDAGGDTGRYEAGRVNEARGYGILWLMRTDTEAHLDRDAVSHANRPHRFAAADWRCDRLTDLTATWPSGPLHLSRKRPCCPRSAPAIVRCGPMASTH